MDKVYRHLVQYLRATDSPLLGYVVRRSFLGIASGLKWKKLPFWMRQIVSMAQASDPLSRIVGPPIDVAIPCHVKDYENLPLVIEGVVTNIRNPLAKILLITPDEYSLKLQRLFPDCQVVKDETVLGPELVSLIFEMVPKNARGWVTQQVIKLRVASMSKEIGTLVLDSDTVLLRPRVWVGSNNSQILCFANEYHLPYKEHQRRVFGGRSQLMSFVTHHQLMKTDAVRDIFGSDDRALLDWIRLADYREGSALSEFDTYGEWITSNRPKETRFAKWNNLPVKIPPGTRYSDLRAKYGDYHSVSNHTYL